MVEESECSSLRSLLNPTCHTSASWRWPNKPRPRALITVGFLTHTFYGKSPIRCSLFWLLTLNGCGLGHVLPILRCATLPLLPACLEPSIESRGDAWTWASVEATAPAG